VRHTTRAHDKTKKNPLKNAAIMNRLNPFAAKKVEILAKLEASRQAKKAANLKAKRSKAGKKGKLMRTTKYEELQTGLRSSFKDAEAIIEADERAGNYQPGDSDDEDEEEAE